MSLPTIDSFRAQLRDLGLDQYAAELAARSLPAIRLHPAPAENADAQIGTTRLGGEPDLPPDFAWPTFRGDSQKFVAQINLQEIAPFVEQGLLPAAGLLSFFYIDDVSTFGLFAVDRGGWSVHYFPATEQLQRTPFPDQRAPHARFNPVRLSPARESTFLPGESYQLEQLGLNDEERLSYAELMATIGESKGIVHQLLGHPAQIQNDMQLECQFVTHGLDYGVANRWNDSRVSELTPGADQWRLLLQIDSDNDANMEWGDAGRIYYWIQSTDLTERRFDRCWFQFQCY